MKGILLIYTGGTIGMMEDLETGSLVPLNFNELKTYIPELKRFAFNVDVRAFDHPIDSSDVRPDSWLKMGQLIYNHYDDYDGFVILHGTDTMAYSASALSFMLQNLQKPVVFTGSQLPIGKLRTDGKENLVTAIEIASAKRNGEAVIQEVSVLFDSNLFRGNRTHKFSTENFDAFISPNYDSLAHIGIYIKYELKNLLRPKGSISLSVALDHNVAILKIFPGMSIEYIKAILNIPNLKGIVLETFGSGNAPKDPILINEFRNAIEKGICILNVTQCSKGFVEQGRYATSAALQKIGVTSGADMTTEAAITKLMFLLGQGLEGRYLHEALITPISGEMTIFSSISE